MAATIDVELLITTQTCHHSTVSGTSATEITATPTIRLLVKTPRPDESTVYTADLTREHAESLCRTLARFLTVKIHL